MKLKKNQNPNLRTLPVYMDLTLGTFTLYVTLTQMSQKTLTQTVALYVVNVPLFTCTQTCPFSHIQAPPPPHLAITATNWNDYTTVT